MNLHTSTQFLNEVFTVAPNCLVAMITAGSEDAYVQNALRHFTSHKSQFYVLNLAPRTYINPKYAETTIHLSSRWDPYHYAPLPQKYAAKDTIEILPRHPNSPLIDYRYNSLTLQERTFIEIEKFRGHRSINGWQTDIGNFFTN